MFLYRLLTGTDTEPESDNEPAPNDDPNLFGYESEDSEWHKENEPAFDSPLYEGADCTLNTVLFAVLTFSIAHRISASCLQDLLTLLTEVLPKNNKLNGSVYLFFKYFDKFKTEGTRFYYCHVCSLELVSKDSICDNCGPGNKVNYFIHVSIIEQLKKLFKVPNFFSSLSYSKNREQTENYQDIYDGRLYKNVNFNCENRLTFLWNTDGFSLFKSSSFEIWPFFLSVNELPPFMRFKNEFIVMGGLWFGHGKPDPNLFLKPLLDEIKVLMKGCLFEVFGFVEPILFKAGILGGTCDSPAKSTFLRLKNFNGLYGCPKCLTRGEKSIESGKVFVYRFEANLNLRTPQNYLSQLEQLRDLRVNRKVKAVRGIKGPSILNNLLIGPLITSTSIDIMHCLFLGTVKSLMKLWFDVKYKEKDFNVSEKKDVVSSYLANVRPPHCVQRAPQSLDKIKFWKASEFMAFFFYYSLPVLNLVLYQLHFNHFKLLFLGVSLLCQNSVSENDIIKSQSLLDSFVEQYQVLYGLRHMSFNLHLIRHLPEIVRDFGPLWTTSCFMFENLNGILKSLVHGTQYAGLQVQNNFEIFSQLSTLVDNLQPGRLRDFCMKMMSPNARLHISERIDHDTCIVGTMKSSGNTVSFSRLKVKSCLYVCRSERETKRNSSFVSYKLDGTVYRGILSGFEKTPNCQCVNDCTCPKYVAMVKRLVSEIAFRTVWPVHDIFSTHSYNETGTVDRIPISDIIGLCVEVSIEENHYTIDFINENYFQ